MYYFISPFVLKSQTNKMIFKILDSTLKIKIKNKILNQIYFKKKQHKIPEKLLL